MVLLPLAFTGSVIARWEGALLLGLRAAYLVYTVLAAVERPILQGFTVMMWFVTPSPTATTDTFAHLRATPGTGRTVQA